MFPFLVDAGFDPHVIFEPEIETRRPDVTGVAPLVKDSGFQIVVFQKVHGRSAEALAREISGGRTKTVYMVCDVVDIPMVEAADATIAVTNFLKSLYPPHLHHKIHVVHDGIERADAHKTSWSDSRGSPRRPLNAVLITSFNLDSLPLLRTTPDWLNISIVGRYPPENQPFQRLRTAMWSLAGQRSARERLAYLRFLADRRIQRIAWSPSRVYEAVRRADIGIIPVDTSNEEADEGGPPYWQVKSENRLTLMMSAGLPVIATPIPSYESVITHGENGLFARSLEDWRFHLEALRDPGYRRELGEQARASVMERYSMEQQARLLIAALRTVLPDAPG